MKIVKISKLPKNCFCGRSRSTKFQTMKMSKLIQFLLWLAIANLGNVSARDWKSADGSKTFEGILIGYSGDKVTVLRADRQVITFDTALLSAEDREYCLRRGGLVEGVLQQSVLGHAFKIISVGDSGALCEQRFSSAISQKDDLPAGLHLEVEDPSPEVAHFNRMVELRQQRANPGWTPEVFWIHLDDVSTLADGQKYNANLFFAGSFSYETVSGVQSTVRSYALHYDEALDILEEKKNPKPLQKPSNPPESTPAKSSGTAFAITNQGHLITNAHVIAGSKHLKVKLPEGSVNAKVLSVDEVNDLAILKIESETMPLVLEAANVKLGDEILVAGFPNPDLQGTSIKLTRGIISSLKGIKDDTRHFQIDAAVQPGNSGGPMLNKDGKVVGIIVATLAHVPAIESTGAIPQNVNYAIKLDYLIPLIKAVDGLLEVVNAQKDSPGKTSGEKASASTFLLINDPKPDAQP